MKNREIILNWLKRARSGLERAKMGKEFYLNLLKKLV